MHRFRTWIENERFASNVLLKTEYASSVTESMTLTMNQESCLKSGRMFCPCLICDSDAFSDKVVVWSHL